MGVSELRDLEKNEFRSAGAEDFPVKCRSFIIISKGSCKGVAMNINTELINIGGKFSLKLEIKF
jgi:hypothetical protein